MGFFAASSIHHWDATLTMAGCKLHLSWEKQNSLRFALSFQTLTSWNEWQMICGDQLCSYICFRTSLMRIYRGHGCGPITSYMCRNRNEEVPNQESRWWELVNWSDEHYRWSRGDYHIFWTYTHKIVIFLEKHIYKQHRSISLRH